MQSQPSSGRAGLSSGSDGEPDRRAEHRAWVFLTLLCAFLVVVTWLALTYGWGDGLQRRQETPCEDQAPPECIDETIEQASSSQFVRYRYCACMTTEGAAKGYIAADTRNAKAD